MKFMIDEAYELDSYVEEDINESTGKRNKTYWISGTFSTPEKKNRNGRIYSKALWEREVDRYQKEIRENTVNTLGEFEHPSRTAVDPMEAVMKITELKMEDGLVKGKAKILNNNSPKTNQLKALIDEGMKIGVSSRGVGSVKNGIVESFRLICYDAVSFPSDFNANLTGISESLNESIGNTDFTVNESGSIVQVCNESACHMFEQKDIHEATKQKFDELLKSLTAPIYEANDLQSKYDEIQKALTDYFKMWKSIEKEVDRKTYNELRELQHQAGMNLAKLSDQLRELKEK